MVDKRMAAAAVFGMWLNGQANARAANQAELDIAIAQAAANREEEAILRRGAAAFQAMNESDTVEPTLLAQVREAEAIVRERIQQRRAAERQSLIARQEQAVKEWVKNRSKELSRNHRFYLGFGALYLVVSTAATLIGMMVASFAGPALGFGWMVVAWFGLMVVGAIRTGWLNAKIANAVKSDPHQQQLLKQHSEQLAHFDQATNSMLTGEIAARLTA